MPRPRPMISYAQNREDVLLDRALADIESGFYVDVGANDPDVYSLTRYFYEQGWRGINIEPGSVYLKLCQARPRDVNLNVAVSDTAGSMFLHEYPHATGLSSLESTIPDVPTELLADAVVRPVSVRPLRDIFAEHNPPTIDFLSIDVEGHERQVLLSNDWSRWRPRIVVVEATEPMKRTPTHHLWEDVLLSADYLFAWFDGLNRFYVRREDAARVSVLAVPPNVFDQFVVDPEGGSQRELVHGLARLQEHVAHMQQVIDNQHVAILRYQEELDKIYGDIGYRSCQVGLWVARQLSRAMRGARSVSLLLSRRARRPAA